MRNNRRQRVHAPLTAGARVGPEQLVNQFRLCYGPTLRAFAALEEKGRTALRRDLERLWSEHNRASDGTTRVDAEYLEVVGVR
jgi:hypothetical protein